MLECLVVILQSFWLMLPAYVSNSSAVLVGGGKPVDLGRTFFDNKRIFGDGKTWLGLIGGIIIGMGVGSAQIVSLNIAKIYNYYNNFIPEFDTNTSFVVILFCLCFGAMFGDLLKSFVKRRLGIERGKKLMILDQLDFVLGAWLFLIIFSNDWFFRYFKLPHIIFILLVTPLFHRVVNMIGYKLGKKKVPW
ncbi:MAG: CDP-2,3-bis-(O-geranylgeranyl)-sn-glycerol synthase [Candidatus Thermoplasmatota archaeon]|nr:CDP-2,3-bis-(O-geranylgeranyl)-sn-glycerol synthase [Candidatus Thermoplasmatota archaeon]